MNVTPSEFAIRYGQRIPDIELQIAADVGAEIATQDVTTTWLRLTVSEQAGVVTRLSGQAYRVFQGTFLTPLNSAVPLQTLPELVWEPLKPKIQHSLSTIQLPESLATRNWECEESGLTVSLVPAADIPGLVPPEPAGMIVAPNDLYHWAEGAGQQRLSSLRWIQLDSEIVVLGSPLPPIDGRFFVQVGRILIPSGWWWKPVLPVDVVEEILAKGFDRGIDALFLWHRDSSVSMIPNEIFASLRRGALRQWAKDALANRDAEET